MTDRYLTKLEVENIPQKDLPLIVLTDNAYSFFAWAIREHCHGVYNHFALMIHEGKFATQDMLFREVPSKDYLKGKHRLKFIHCPLWLPYKKRIFTEMINDELNRHWFHRRYDFLQLIGFLTGIRKLQIPWLRVCSDWADYIKVMDSNFPTGQHLSPIEINEYTKTHGNYKVYGRYVPD